MKTVKPFRLGVLTRPYRWQQQNLLGTSVIALISLGDQPMLMSEQALWKLVDDEADPGCVLDLGIPKAFPEMLASGLCYTAHQDEKTSCTAKIQVGALVKSLRVSGERQWLNGRPSEPQPFEALRVDWRHAFGGPRVPENPLGIGTFDEGDEGSRNRRLPNVEALQGCFAAPGERLQPAGFSAIPPDWPQRMSLVGKDFGKRWQENDFPGFAADMDWQFFNAAAPDQRWPDRHDLPPGAAYDIWNMHPDIPRLQGCLPNWRARCFTSTEEDGGDLRETSLRLTTVWFFPHRERAVLMWQGASAIREDDGLDVHHIMPALELHDAPRTLAHYQGVLYQRLNPESALSALRDSDLVPRAVMGEPDDVERSDSLPRPMLRKLRAGQLRDYDARRTDLLARGLEPEKFLGPPPNFKPPPPVEDLPGHFERLAHDAENQKKELLRRAEAMRSKAELDLGATRPPGVTGERVRFDLEKLTEGLERLESFAQKGTAPAAISASRGDVQRDFSARLRKSYLHAAHLSAPAPAMQPSRSESVRHALAQRAVGQRSFSGMNLIGADLSGMDLRGADFSGAALEDANLNDAQLDDCNFSGAVLARATLIGTSLQRATLDSANLGDAQCTRSSFSGATFRNTNCQKAQFQACDLGKAVFEQADLHGANLTQCDLRESVWQQVALMKMQLEDLAFDNAIFERVVWIKCALHDISFDAARFQQCGFIASDCSQHVDFSRAVLIRSSFAQESSLADAVFRDVTLQQCGFRTVSLARADLSGARLDSCDFSECNLRGARLDRLVAGGSLFVRADLSGATLRGADMIDTILSKAVLASADFQRANLFRADLSQTLIDAGTRMDDAYLHRARTRPRRSGSPS